MVSLIVQFPEIWQTVLVVFGIPITQKHYIPILMNTPYIYNSNFFFKFLGDSFVTERLFCLVISILNVIGISKCWRLIHKQTEYEVIEWLPVFLMFTVPLVSWSYKNNLLENTLSCFTILQFSLY